MGLFDFFKKKDGEIEIQEKEDDVVFFFGNEDEDNGQLGEAFGSGSLNDGAISVRTCTNNDNRRYFLLVEDSFPAKGGDGIVVVGKIAGTIKNGDSLYVMQPGNSITVFNVIGLAVQENGVMKPVEEATDVTVGVKVLNIQGINQIPQFAVLTSICHQPDVKSRTGIQNPYICGLATGFHRFGNNKRFSDILLNELFNAKFLAAIYMEELTAAELGYTNSDESDNDVQVQKKQNVKPSIQFPALPVQNGEQNAGFALFTDWYELGLWKDVFDETHPPKTMLLRFADCVEMVCAQKDNQIPYLVINAFGQYPIRMPAEMVRRVSHSDAYQLIKHGRIPNIETEKKMEK